MNNTDNNRNHEIDLARTICILWVVGFYHLLSYFPSNYQLTGRLGTLCYDITICVLACFTFLSGYFLKKYTFNSFGDVLFFYKKRMQRFYPLFVIASLTLLFFGSNIRQVFFAIIGFSLVIPPPLYTLWYFSMLMLFYMLTPILKIKRNARDFVLFVISFIALMLFSYLFADKRIMLYLPFYLMGLNISNDSVEKWLSKNRIVVYLFFFVVCEFFRQYTISHYYSYCFLPFEAMAGVILLLSLTKCVYSKRLEKPVTFIAEASMCAYLFHRQIYSIILIFLKHVTGHTKMSIPIAVVSVIVVFYLASLIQRAYNKLLARMQIK
jgi:surface polysaccharide O-acyltransferase-like enzyme